MASNAALKVADIVDEILSIANKTNSAASITLAARGDGTFNFQLTTMSKSEQFSTLGGVESYLAALQSVIGAETDKAAAHRLVFVAREKRKLEAKAAQIAQQLVELDKPYAPVVDAGE